MSNPEQENSSKIFDVQPPKRHRPISKFHQIRGAVMGCLYIIVAVGLVWAEKNNFTTFGLNFSYALAAVFVIYGIFRLYRAFFQK